MYNDGFVPDPSQQVQQGQPGQAIDTTSSPMSALQGFGQSATLGALPYLQAAGSYGAQALAPGVSANWQSTLAAMKQNQALAQQAHPAAYLGGELGGGLATAPLFGAENLGLALAKNAAAGATAGYLNSPDGNTNTGTAIDTGLGAALGAGGQLVAHGIGAAATGLKNYFGRQYLASALEAANKDPAMQASIMTALHGDVPTSASQQGAQQALDAWFGKGSEQPILSFGGESIHPTDPRYASIAQQLKISPAQAPGIAPAIIAALKDPKMSISDIRGQILRGAYASGNPLNNYTSVGMPKVLPSVLPTIGQAALGGAAAGVKNLASAPIMGAEVLGTIEAMAHQGLAPGLGYGMAGMAAVPIARGAAAMGGKLAANSVAGMVSVPSPMMFPGMKAATTYPGLLSTGTGALSALGAAGSTVGSTVAPGLIPNQGGGTYYNDGFIPDPGQ
jgi:hypothetical protein